MKILMKRMAIAVAVVMAGSVLPGAAMGQMGDSGPVSAKAGDLPEGLFAKELPADAKTLAEVRAAAKVGKAVTVRARVSSAKDAFGKGRSAFTVVDAEGAESAIVQVVDAAGAVLKTELKNRGGLAAGAEVAVTGVLVQAEAGKPMSINASRIFVLPPDVPAGFFLGAAPEGSKPVEEVKQSAKKGESVVIRGRIGGSEAPFVEGRSVFTIVGPGLKACSDHEDDHCKIPWDYCCETKSDIVLHSATIQVLDASNKPLKVGVKGRGGLKELSDVSVVGKVMAVDAKTIVVQATGLYIHPTNK